MKEKNTPMLFYDNRNEISSAKQRRVLSHKGKTEKQKMNSVSKHHRKIDTCHNHVIDPGWREAPKYNSAQCAGQAIQHRLVVDVFRMQLETKDLTRHVGAQPENTGLYLTGARVSPFPIFPLLSSHQ